MHVLGSDYIVNKLAEYQTEFAFVLPGAQIDPLFRSLVRSNSIRPVIANHELGAGYMADGYARASEGIGVCISIGGPGASNLLTAAVTARLDESSVLFLTGNVPTHLQGLGAFQDASTSGTRDVELFQQAVTYSAVVSNPQSLNQELQKALLSMMGSYRSPAHLSVPFDIQNHIYDASTPGFASSSITPTTLHVPLTVVDFGKICNALTQNTKILMLVGPRASSGEASGFLRRFAETFCIPVATTLSAKGVLPETHPLSLGNFGFGGNQRATAALLREDVELLLLVGLDFNDQDSLCWEPKLYPENRTLLRIDSKPLKSPHTVAINYDIPVPNCALVLEELLNLGADKLSSLVETAPERLRWLELLEATPWNWPSHSDNLGTQECIPLDVLVQALRSWLSTETLLCVDAGATRLFAGQSWTASRPGSFFSASSTAPMGWAIGAAIGVQLAHPESPVVVLTGDGSMRMHGLELATAARYRLPILFIVCNNQAYGSVYRRLQDDPVVADQALLPPVDWVQFAQSLGVPGIKVCTLQQLYTALDKALSTQTTFLLEVPTPSVTQNFAPITGRLLYLPK